MAPAYGFIMVTAVPLLRNGARGSPWDLVRFRLSNAKWPLYRRTRNREHIVPGSRLAFYVAGKGERGGDIVATATVDKRVPASWRRQENVDPSEYISDIPYIVLTLTNISYLATPICFRAALRQLSFCPSNMNYWGKQLQGGTRTLNEQDWRALLAAGRPSQNEAGDAT